MDAKLEINIFVFFRSEENYHIFNSFQTRSNDWSKTEINYHTERPSRLPMADVAVQDIGKAGQAFAVEVSWVCFQTQDFHSQ